MNFIETIGISLVKQVIKIQARLIDNSNSNGVFHYLVIIKPLMQKL